MGSAGAMPSRALAGGGHARVLDLRGCHCKFFFLASTSRARVT